MFQRLWRALLQGVRNGWQTIQAHRRAALIFLIGLAVLWVVTAATWLYSPDGYSYGMQPVVFWLHFAFPVVGGYLVMRGAAPLSARLRWAAGLVLGYCVLDMALLLVWSGVLTALGKTMPNAQIEGPAEGLFEVLHMGLAFVIAGLVLALLGWLLAWLYSLGKRYLHRPR